MSQSTRDTSIAQLFPVLCWHVGQLRAPLRWNPQRICAHKHFNALGCIHIFAGTAYCSVGGTHGSCQSTIFAYVILPVRLGFLPLLPQGREGGHTSAPHWIRSWASPNNWVAIEKQAHAIVKTKDLHSAYCRTGGCTHHLPFCLSLSPARFLHSYACPSGIYKYHRNRYMQQTVNPWVAVICVCAQAYAETYVLQTCW